jgi:hypothetical protein
VLSRVLTLLAEILGALFMGIVRKSRKQLDPKAYEC